MKRLLFFLLFLTASHLFAQTGNLKLSGKITTVGDYKYVFLYDETTKTRYVKLIEENKFEFIFSKPSNLENKLVTIYLGKDSTRTYEDAKRRYAFVDPESRQIVLEDSVEIFIVNGIMDAVIKGGKLNKDLTEMQASIKSKKYSEYFASHQDSPISISFLSALFALRNNEMFIQYGEKLDYKAIYSSFCSKLKESVEGKKLGELIYGK